MSFFLGDPFFAGDLVVDELTKVLALAILNTTEVAASMEINPVMIIGLHVGMQMRSDFYAGL